MILIQFVLIIIMVIWIICQGGMEYLSSGPKTLIYYSNPNCGYCKRFDPVWAALTKKSNGIGGVIKFRKINCLKDSAQCAIAKEKYGMNGTPFIVLLNNSKYTVFKGDRQNIDEIMTFIT
jgi:protein-disulfide isomerase